LPSQVYASLLKDPDFKASHQLSSPEKIWRGEVDTLGGFRVVRSNAPGFAATSQVTAGAAIKSILVSHCSFCLSGSRSTEPSGLCSSSGGQTDPLQQAESSVGSLPSRQSSPTTTGYGGLVLLALQHQQLSDAITKGELYRLP